MPVKRRARGAGKRTSARRQWAPPRPSVDVVAAPFPGATQPGSRRAIRWLGLDCCTFFFVRCIFRNKKKSPTLHTTSSAALKTRSPATAAWGDEDNRLPRTPQPGGWDGHWSWDLSPGSSQGLQPEHNQHKVNCCAPAQPCTCISAGFRLNTSGPVLVEILFQEKHHYSFPRREGRTSNWLQYTCR